MMRGRWPFRIYRFVGGHWLGSGVKARPRCTNVVETEMEHHQYIDLVWIINLT